MIDFKVWLLKMHFALYFVVRDWLLEKFRPLGIAYKYVGGIVFVLDDYITNKLLYFKWGEDVGHLVTDRLKEYKKLSEHDERYKWAVKLCEFANKYDEDHC